MNVNMHRALLIGSVAFAGLVGYAGMVSGADTQPARQGSFDRLIHALQVDDRNAFLSNATDEMKQALTPRIMDSVSHNISPHMDNGFQAGCLGQLKQQGYDVQLWKMTFHDGSDDALVRITMRDDRLAGFVIQ